MRRPSPRSSIALLTTALLSVLLALPSGAQLREPARLPPDVDPAIDEIIAPLAHAPAVLTPGDVLVVELDEAAVGSPDPLPVSASLARVDGAGGRIDLGTADTSRALDEGLWPGRPSLAIEFPLAGVPDGFYDLTVTWQDPGAPPHDPDTDTQRRAVRVMDKIPTAPRVAILADPSIGDPRPIQEGVTEMLPPGLPYPPDTAGELDALPPKVLGTTGNPAEGEERWAALVTAIDEINLVQPDLVLIAGDLTFAVHPRAMPYEYAEAWQVLDRLQVPSFASPGNHDLYALDYDRYGDAGDPAGRPATADGVVEWQRWFGPLHYSADIGEDFHLVSLNTFDHPDKRPFPPEDEFDTLSSGQLSAAQLEWLVADLTAYRQRSPEGALVTLAHHDPSWLSGRHPWRDGTNRDLARRLMAEFDVWAHFSGHTHEDRVARYHRGSIAETNGRQHRAEHYPLGELHYLDAAVGDLDCAFSPHPLCDERADVATILSQDELAEIIDDPSHGPLFVSTTTTASGLLGDVWGLGGYWGWRLADLVPQEDGGYRAGDMGYAADADPAEVRAFLDALAERPERWDEDHARLGVHSIPTGFLDVETAADGRSATITNDLLDDMEVTVTLTASPLELPSAGEVVRRTATSVDVRLQVAAGTTRDVSIR